MSAGFTFAQSPYGAFELKRVYQKHMLMGTLISCAIPLFVMLIFVLVGLIRGLGASEVPIDANAAPIYIDLNQLPPPTIQKTVTKPELQKEKIELPKIGIPTPVADEEVMEVQVLATNLQKVDLAAAELGDGATGDLFGQGTVIGVLDDILPKPDEFVAFDQEPQLLNAPEPEYPEMAKRAGITGTVWMKVLVDKEGNVRDAIVVKESGVNAGFEEAAKAAAWGRKYRPAMQNNQPVAVWVAYRVKFELRTSN